MHFKDIIVRDAVTEDDINHLNGIAQKMKMIAKSDKPKELILGNFLEKDLEFQNIFGLKRTSNGQ